MFSVGFIIGFNYFPPKVMLAGAPSGSMVWGGVGSLTGMGYIGIQLFSAKMMLAGAPPGSEVWGGVGASTGMGYIGIQLFSAKMLRGRRSSCV